MRLLVARVSLSIEEYVTWRHSCRERFSRLLAQHSFADSPQNLDNAHPLRRPKKTKIWQEFSWNLQCLQRNRRTAALHVPVCLNVKAFHITEGFATWRASCRAHTQSRAARSTWKIQHVDCLGTSPLKVCWCELLLTEHSRESEAQPKHIGNLVHISTHLMLTPGPNLSDFLSARWYLLTGTIHLTGVV